MAGQIAATRGLTMAAGAMFSDLSVDEIMDRWPATIRVFIRHDILCIGCAIGRFHTLGEA